MKKIKEVIPKKKKCNHLLTFRWFQSCMGFFMLLNTQKNLLLFW